MKKFSLCIVLIILLFLLPSATYAHGGVEKQAGNILVTLFQTPLSPLVGEKVDFAFILSDLSKTKMLKYKQARIVVTQTTVGDPTKDKVVYTNIVKSDINGIVNFSYTFPKTNYYDIDLELGKPNDEANTTGFLVQPRENLQYNIRFLELISVVSLILNFVFIFFWLRGLLRLVRS